MSDSTTRPPPPPPPQPVTGYPAPPPPRSNGHQPYFSTATAYPYAAPHPPSNYYYAPNPDPRRAAFIRRFLLAMISVFIVIGCIFFILWLVLRPRIPEFHVASLSLSNFSVSTAPSEAITGNFRAQFRVVNPNKKVELGYSDVRSWITYDAEELAITTLPPFKQETGNVTTLEASYAAMNSYLKDKAAKDLAGERGRGEVRFQVKFSARMGMKAGAWRWRDRWLRVLCDDVRVGVSGNSTDGKLVGGESSCTVAI